MTEPKDTMPPIIPGWLGFLLLLWLVVALGWIVVDLATSAVRVLL